MYMMMIHTYILHTYIHYPHVHDDDDDDDPHAHDDNTCMHACIHNPHTSWRRIKSGEMLWLLDQKPIKMI